MGTSSFLVAPRELGGGKLRPTLHNRLEFPQRFPVTRFENVLGELIQHRRHRGQLGGMILGRFSQHAFPILSVIAILAVSFFIGSAMQSANLKWVAVATSGVGKAWPEYNAEAFGRKLASWTREKLKTFERENAKKVPVYVGLSLRSDPITQEARRSFENGAA